MSKLPNKIYDFEVSIDMESNSYFVSPYSIPDVKGRFTVHIEENSKLTVVSNLLETPPAQEEIDAFSLKTVKLVCQDTRYNQRLKPIGTDDFQVQGHIQFVIEPRCTLEKIPILFKYEAGKLRVEIFNC